MSDSPALDDIYGDVDPNTDPSDIPRLRGVHVTAGYRDGIAASKGASVQGGFDEGFALGAAVGRKVGFVVGVLEGMGRGVVGAGVGRGEHDGEGDGRGSRLEEGEGRGRMLEEVGRLGREARRELGAGRVFSREFFDEDGVWVYEVEGWRREGEDEDDVTVEMVAAAHPLIKSWEARIAQLAERLGVNLAALDDGYL